MLLLLVMLPSRECIHIKKTFNDNSKEVWKLNLKKLAKKKENGRMKKAPPLKSSDLHFSVINCQCRTYDYKICPKFFKSRALLLGAQPLGGVGGRDSGNGFFGPRTECDISEFNQSGQRRSQYPAVRVTTIIEQNDHQWTMITVNETNKYNRQNQSPVKSDKWIQPTEPKSCQNSAWNQSSKRSSANIDGRPKSFRYHYSSTPTTTVTSYTIQPNTSPLQPQQQPQPYSRNSK